MSAPHHSQVNNSSNGTRRAFYPLAWHIGASQSDIAFLDAENIDWEKKIISFARRKTGQLSQVHFGDEAEAILKTLAPKGPLFSYLRRVRAGDRSTEFQQRCRRLGICGVSRHLYWYAWAERARRCGYPERFAQEALGHNSLAVHRAYAKRAKVILPTLEVYEQRRQNDTIVPLPTATSTTPLLGQGDQTSAV